MANFPSMSFGCLAESGITAKEEITNNTESNMNTYEEDSEYEKARIMLTDCPKEMTKDGVYNLCIKFGELAKGVHVPRKPGTFFVEYLTQSCAEQAIRYINEKKELGIRAQFARKQQSNENGASNNSQPQNNRVNHKYEKPKISMDQRSVKGPFTKPMHLSRNERNRNSQPAKNNETQADPKQKEFNGHDETKPYVNLLKDEGRFSRATDGRHKVLNGRASFQESEATLKALKHASVQSKGSYKSENNVYSHNGEAAKDILLGTCIRCEKPAEQQCKVCMDYYCSQECQRLDWPKHKKDCRPMPELTPIRTVAPNQSNNIAPPQMSTNIVSHPASFLPLPTPQAAPLFPLMPQRQQFLPMNVALMPDFPNGSHLIMQPPPFKNPNFQPPARPHQQQQQQQRTPNQGGQNLNIAEEIKIVTEKLKAGKSDAENQGGQNLNITEEIKNLNIAEEIKIVTDKLKAEKLAAEPKKIQENFAPFPKSGSMVTITSASSAGMIFIRHREPDVNRAYFQIIQDVAKYAETAKFLTEKPKVNSFVLGKYENGYYRALVINSNSTCSDEDVRVAFLDFGNIATTKWKELKDLTDRTLIEAVRYCFRVYLKNVDYSKHTNDNTMALLNDYVDRMEDFQMIYHELNDKKREVTLLCVHNKINVSDKIRELSVIVPPTDNGVYGTEVLVRRGIPDGCNSKLFILDTSLLQHRSITCILYNDKSNLLAIESKIKEYCSTVGEQYTPRRFELCLAKFEGEWYRGFCIEVVGDQHPTICFIDYGNLTPVSIEDIRKIPIELACLPVYSKFCEIDGLPEDCTDLMPRLEEKFFVGQEIFVDEVKNVVSDSEDIMETYAVLKMSDIIKWL